MLSFVMNEAMRDLRRAGRIGLAAILLIALSLTALGGFWLLSLNLGRAIDQWGDRVRVIVYLKDGPTPAKLDDLLQRGREEMEIMGVVGPAETVTRAPRLPQGMAGGVVAAIMARAEREIGYGLAVPRLEPLLPMTLGLERVTFLSPLQALAVIGAG